MLMLIKTKRYYIGNNFGFDNAKLKKILLVAHVSSPLKYPGLRYSPTVCHVVILNNTNCLNMYLFFNLLSKQRKKKRSLIFLWVTKI